MKQTDLEKLKEEIKIKPLFDTVKLLDMSDEEYFSHKYAHCISNSRLSLINPDEGGSVEKYMGGLKNSSVYSDSLLFGSAVHGMVLQPNDFEVASSCDRPTAKLGFVADEIIKNRKKGLSIYKSILEASNKIDYYRNKMTDDRIKNVIAKSLAYYYQVKKYVPVKTPIFLSDKDKKRLNSCLKSIEVNRNIKNLLNPDFIVQEPININEGVILMDVEATIDNKTYIYTLKAKLDNFILDFESCVLYLNDLKTSGKYLSDFKDSFKKYHYYRQMAMYYWMLQIYVNKTYPNVKNLQGRANMVVVSTIPDYYSGIFKVNKEQMKVGKDEFAYLLRLVIKATHEQYNVIENEEL